MTKEDLEQFIKSNGYILNYFGEMYDTYSKEISTFSLQIAPECKLLSNGIKLEIEIRENSFDIYLTIQYKLFEENLELIHRNLEFNDYEKILKFEEAIPILIKIL